MGSADVRLYPDLDRAIQDGAVLACYRESAKDGYARVAGLGRGDALLALGTGVTLPDALAALEHDHLHGGRAAEEFRADQCLTCAMNRLDPAGSSAAVSALDVHLLDGHSFEVTWADGQFRLVTEWRREARLPREVMRGLIAGGVPTRWRHGEFVWDIVPGRSRKTGSGRSPTSSP